MSVPSGNQLAVGFRYAYLYQLGSHGRPVSPSGLYHPGLRLRGAQAFTLNIPEMTRITHTGEDGVLGVMYLPSKEPVSGEIRTGVDNISLDQVLTNTHRFVVGEAAMLPVQTDKQGTEPLLGGMFYQQSMDLSTGEMRWRTYIIPAMRIIPMPAGFSDAPEGERYTFVVTPVSKHLWGPALSTTIEGATRTTLFRTMTEGQPLLALYTGDGTTKTFSFETDKPALSTAKIAVFHNGAEVTTGITKATTGVTFTTAPVLDDDLQIWLEH